MNAIPKVSVCIPAYNHAKYINDAIQSVLAQDFLDFEIVITDDASTDGTVDEIISIRDARIRLFKHPRNMGPSVAANNNVAQARGEFVCFLTSDDIFEPNKLSRQLAEFAREPQLGAVFSHMRFINESGADLAQERHGLAFLTNIRREEVLRRALFEGNCLSAPTAMIRRAVLVRVGALDPRLLQTQDFEYWIRICLDSEIAMVEEPLVSYRIRAALANADANTPAKVARIHWELPRALERLLEWKDEALFLRCFPEARPFIEQGLSIAGSLAVLALQATPTWARCFGIEALYRELGKAEALPALEAAGYGFPRFFELLAEVDPTHALATLAPPDVEERLRSAQAEAVRVADDLQKVIEARDWFRSQAEAWEAEYRRAVKH